jgi:hypothetical protein
MRFAAPCYLRQDIHVVSITRTSLTVTLISMFVGDQPRGTMRLSLKCAITSSGEGAGMIADPTGATAFHRPVCR